MTWWFSNCLASYIFFIQSTFQLLVVIILRRYLRGWDLKYLQIYLNLNLFFFSYRSFAHKIIDSIHTFDDDAMQRIKTEKCTSKPIKLEIYRKVRELWLDIKNRSRHKLIHENKNSLFLFGGGCTQTWTNKSTHDLWEREKYFSCNYEMMALRLNDTRLKM